MKLDDLMTKIAEYGITVLAGKAKSTGAKMLIGSGTVIAVRKARAVIETAGLVDGAGEVDVDTLAEALRAGFKAAGKVSVLGGALGFDANDAEELIAYVQGEGVTR